MDGEINPGLPRDIDPGVVPAIGFAPGGAHPTPSRAKRVRWFVIVAVLVALVLGGLYGFSTWRQRMIHTYLTTMKPPPAAISAVVATSEAVPHFASGIGSLAAVRQVTVSSEIGGRIVAITFESGAAVKAGDRLAQIDDGPDRGDLANYQAQARYAETSLQRAKILASHQYGTQQTVDQTQSQLDQSSAMIQKTQAVIGQKEIRAPFGGRLGVRQINLGQYLTPGAAIVSLTDLSTLYVNFTLPTQIAPQIAVGQKVDVSADAFPGRTFIASITTIEPQISASTRTVAVQATMPNPDEALLPGMFVNAKVVLPNDADQVVLPETAVDYTLYGDSVYVIRADGNDADGKPLLTAHRTPVTTGLRWDNKVAVLTGLKPGDQVVAAGQIKVQDGARVSVTGNPPPQPPANPTLQ